MLGHNGTGKSCLMKMLSGAYHRDAGEICVNGELATINNPRDARRYNIETIYQTLALGVQETQMVSDLIDELKKQGIGIFLIDHDIHQVKQLCDRASVMKSGKLVGTVNVDKVTEDDLLSMIILGKNRTGKSPYSAAILITGSILSSHSRDRWHLIW